MDEDLVVRLHRIERQLTADRIALERRLDQLDRRLAELPTLIGAALDTKRSDTDSALAGGAPRAASRGASRASTATGTAPLDKTAAYLVALVELFAEHTGRSAGTVSRLATGSGDTIVRLRRGSTITARRADRALRYLSDNWPEDLPWPNRADESRPGRTGSARGLKESYPSPGRGMR